ncbi:MAG: TetR family transcriptional regulator [Solirubrobacteraceae bacterium]
MPAAGQRVPYSVAARELLRNTLLDAACHELQGHQWADITMADIAVAAGVSRQTLYKEFGSREEFAQVLVMREAERFLDAVESTVRKHLADPSKALGAAFDLFLTEAAENPLLRAIVLEEGAEELLALLTTHGKPLVERAADRLTEVMVAGWPLMRRRDAELLGDVLVRLAISYAALPSGAAGKTAAAVSSLFEPYVEKLVGEGLR